ncbi:MAG: sigma-54-dependent Fis family transcriptional regulator [Gammaproteobacteria bacterium]|nr:sigma-54-dependent Fis family transcriptional regulator [Gammaproteobacteria bacterium]
MSNILIVDDDAASCRTLQLHLRGQEHSVSTAYSVDEGLNSSRNNPPDLLILDIRMPGRSGLEGLPLFKQEIPGLKVIMITAFHDMESTIEAMQRGAEEYIHKPIDIDELDAAIAKLLSSGGADEDLLSTRTTAEVNQLTMVGRSRVMKEIFKTIGMVAKSPATVLITGESGTGKELVARAIHRAGDHPEGPFVAVNCAALVETLLESDMFGHEKGAFTGAVVKQEGKFSLARGGTIFLDEIGEISQSMQAKLLRVLQYKEFTPLGAKQVHTTDARIITATNVDLEQKVKDGLFREDLYYRLQVVNIHLPPLRERKEDLKDLVQTLLGRINRELRRNITHISWDAVDCLETYDWPGNIRELENVLMKTVALSHGDTLNRDLLPDHLCISNWPSTHTTMIEKPLDQWSLEEVEREHIKRVLDATSWHRGQACTVLDISRPRLRRMIRHYKLKPPTHLNADEDIGEE